MPVQWVHLGAGLLIASSRGAWIQPPGLDGLAFSGPMPRFLPGTRETTRHLLDGAIAAAEREAQLCDPPPMTPLRWVCELVNQWYVASESIALLEEAWQLYDGMRRPDIAAFTEKRLADERGHDQFPLNDLTALGYSAAEVVRRVPPAPAAAALVAYAAQAIRGAEPVEFLGYIHAMERHVIRLSPEWFAELERVLPEGVDATSGLRAHAAELDTEHVEEAIAFFAGLPADDRTRLAVGCYRTTVVRNAPTEAPEPSWDDLGRRLAPLHAQHRISNQEGALP